MKPAQCRAARALQNLTQPKLAEASGVGLSTVVDFERSRRAVSEEAVDAIRTALESAGVIFVEENGEGPGVRLKKQRKGVSSDLRIPTGPATEVVEMMDKAIEEHRRTRKPKG